MVGKKVGENPKSRISGFTKLFSIPMLFLLFLREEISVMVFILIFNFSINILYLYKRCAVGMDLNIFVATAKQCRRRRQAVS
jgi:hypothetical protein